VHPAEVLGALQALGEAGDRDRGGVAGEDRSLFEQRFHLDEDRLLHLLVLDDRLDDEVDRPEVAVGERRADPAERLGIFAGVIFPRETCFSRSLPASWRPRSIAFGLMSFMKIGIFFTAD